MKLRSSEWLLLCYFVYAAVLSAWWARWPSVGGRALWIFLAVGLLLVLVAAVEIQFPVAISRFRDFLPLGLTLVAFEEMRLFAPPYFNGRLERSWIRWDDLLLRGWHLRTGIESLGVVIPFYLELCYLLVYGLGTYCVIALYVKHKRREVDRFFFVLLTGTLSVYALLPFFPSQPPRLLFPELDGPTVMTWVRRLNLWILRKASIEVGVFPSAHVSSAFAAAWAMFLLLPQKRFGWGVLVYAISVSVATIYGRYHYFADVAAGLGVSLITAVVALWMRRFSAASPVSQGRNRSH
jgi:membrane-associated phospholipid phosphatase